MKNRYTLSFVEGAGFLNMPVGPQNP